MKREGNLFEYDADMTLKNKFLFGFLLLHLGVISIISFDIERNIPHPLLQVIKWYSTATVLQAKYGFFSPNVSSDPSVQILVYDSKNKVHPFHLPAANHEIALRLHTSYSAFALASDAQDLIARSWAAMAWEKYPDAKRIIINAYSYQLPTMEQYVKGVKPSYYRYYQTTFETN